MEETRGESFQVNQRYLPAAILLTVGSLSSLFAVQALNKQADLARAKRIEAVQTKDAELQKYTCEKLRLYKASEGAKQVERFLADWSLHAEEGSSVGNIVDKLSKLAYDRNLITTRRPTPIREDYPFGALAATVQIVGFTVTGSYPSVIDWLGAVETSMPYARIENVVMRGRNNDIEMEIQLEFMLGITGNGKGRAVK